MKKKMLNVLVGIMNCGSVVWASDLPNIAFKKPTCLDGLLSTILRLIEPFLYVFSFGLIVYTLIKCIKLKASEKEAFKNGEEIKKEKFKYAFVVKNVILAILLWCVATLLGIGRPIVV